MFPPIDGKASGLITYETRAATIASFILAVDGIDLIEEIRVESEMRLRKREGEMSRVRFRGERARPLFQHIFFHSQAGMKKRAPTNIRGEGSVVTQARPRFASSSVLHALLASTIEKIANPHCNTNTNTP